MRRYQPKMPRTAFGLLAATMTALTLAVTVVAPAHRDAGATDARQLAAPQSAARIAAHVDAASTSIGQA